MVDMLCTSYKYCSVIANDCGAEVLTGEVGREQREELMGFPVGYTASINYETVPPQSWPASPTFLLIPPSYDTFGCIGNIFRELDWKKAASFLGERCRYLQTRRVQSCGPVRAWASLKPETKTERRLMTN
jgi:hypothetical protein